MTTNVMPVTFVGGIKTALISFIEEFPDFILSVTKTQFMCLRFHEEQVLCGSRYLKAPLPQNKEKYQFPGRFHVGIFW